MKFKNCKICKNLIIMDGLEFNGENFCKKKCLEEYVLKLDKETLESIPTNICEKCSKDTFGREENFRRTSTSIGFKFYGNDETCSKCHSSIKTRWIIASNLPIFPLGSYRIISTKNGEFKGKKLQKLYKNQIENGLSITIGLLFFIILMIYMIIL